MHTFRTFRGWGKLHPNSTPPNQLMVGSATRTLFRAFLQTARELERRGSALLVQLPVESSRVQWYKPGAPQGEFTGATLATMIRQRFPQLGAATECSDDMREITPDMLRDLVRREFRSPAAADASQLDAAFGALRELHSQVEMMRSTSVTTSEAEHGVRVRVEATSLYRGREGPIWVFQYRIRIINEGSAVVRLLGREWQIKNIDGSLHASVPKGSPGVVGQTPTLEPGEQFEYASGTTFTQPGGSVEGSFQMVSHPAEVPRPFDAIVGRFDCIVHDDDAAR